MNTGFDYQQVVFGSTWDLRREDRDLGGLRLDLALRALTAHPDMEQGRILEAGCGVGRFTAPLRDHLPGSQLVAFDLSQAAVAAARGRGPHAAYLVADTLALPYPAQQFDAVLFFDLVEHLPKPLVALTEFARVLRPGGLLHGYVPCEGQPPTLHWLLAPWVHTWTRRHAGHVQHLRHRDLTGLLEQAGFQVTGRSYSYHLIGQSLDVGTFLIRELVFRRQRGGQRQPEAYYDRSVLGGGVLAGTYGVVRRFVERLAYWETRLLARCPAALGVHVTAERR
jgi:ubiquinone/menaquinone biosynthesis C-methylase UbiE